MQPIVVGARHRRGKTRVLVGEGEDAEATGGKQHGGVDAFGVHRFELDFAGPAALRVVSIDVLVLFKVVAADAACRRCAGCHRNLRKDHAEIAHVLGSPAARRLGTKLRIDVALPKIGWFHDVHVAVEYFESFFAMTLTSLVTSVMPPKARCQANHAN